MGDDNNSPLLRSHEFVQRFLDDTFAFIVKSTKMKRRKRNKSFRKRLQNHVIVRNVITWIYLVASSSKRISGCLTKALAMAIRCFWPPLSCVPEPPLTGVSNPSGKSKKSEKVS
jgi:hypothetical protein